MDSSFYLVQKTEGVTRSYPIDIKASIYLSKL